ncbi:hypothetical protein A5677_09505 [Mycobacterium malmoense]|uniref:Uncharacterized protein n=1 Tax=Mycobacterium malmoense TaxID=1780 RepID=A0A1B9DF93_MYCMA|nr:hypothetical protein A5677_09505 [Mycobacterium malmoense]
MSQTINSARRRSRSIACASTSGGSASQPSDAMITTAPRRALPCGGDSSVATLRPMDVPPYRSVTLALARASATSADRCASTAVSRVSDVENAKTSGRVPGWRDTALIRCRYTAA